MSACIALHRWALVWVLTGSAHRVHPGKHAHAHPFMRRTRRCLLAIAGNAHSARRGIGFSAQSRRQPGLLDSTPPALHRQARPAFDRPPSHHLVAAPWLPSAGVHLRLFYAHYSRSVLSPVCCPAALRVPRAFAFADEGHWLAPRSASRRPGCSSK